MKSIWIINQDATTPDVGYAGRSYYLAEELSKLGHKVNLIAGGFSHLHINSPNITREIEVWKVSLFSFVWINLPSYKDAHSKKRILNWFLFAFRITKMINLPSEKPDVIIYSSPPIIGYLGALYLSNRYNAKLVFEIRDIWPLTLKEIGGFRWYNPIIFLMSKIEKLAYKKSDFIISNLSNAFSYLSKFGVKNSQYLWIPNGISANEISKRISLNPDVDAFIPKDKFVVGYCGTLGVANALEFLLQASKDLLCQEEFVFVIVGTGKEVEKLKLMVKDSRNVIFLDPIPKEQVYALYSRFDVCYLGWRKHSLYEFGIGSNKLPEYLFSGKPILHSYSGKMDLVTIAGAGVTIEAENSSQIVSEILNLKNSSNEERISFGENGKKYAIGNLQYEALAKKIHCKFLLD